MIIVMHHHQFCRRECVTERDRDRDRKREREREEEEEIVSLDGELIDI